MPHNLEITDSDITDVASFLYCDFSDQERKEALKCNVTQDIQACPGSGKTTLLVAKLAILSKKWSWRDRGICVLSHTNVAKHQIENILARHPTAHKLLDYPHFVGTIQSFVDQYLGIPFLRTRNIEVSIIDNERFREKALRLLPIYRNASGWLRHKRNYHNIVAGLKFKFASNELILESAYGKLPREDTPAYSELHDLKRRVTNDGIMRFDDMYSFAEAYIASYSFIVDFLRFRFPWAFIDEMQDTDSKQDRLLQNIFHGNCIYQRLGDINQAIYTESAENDVFTNFPLNNFIEITGSLRFGSSISALSSPLTVMQPQTIIGNTNRVQYRHTIFLFDNNSISMVLRAFAELIRFEYGERLTKDFIAKAIGHRKASADSPENLPYGISDYWQYFQPEFTSRVIFPNKFIGFIRQARDMLRRERESKEAYNLIIEGIIRFLRQQEVLDERGKRFTKTQLLEFFITNDILNEVKEIVYKLLFSPEQLDISIWNTVVGNMLSCLQPLIRGRITQTANSYLEWTEECGYAGACALEHAPNRINIFQHRGVKINLATIHAVKGETHNASLILETFWHVHDLKDLLPYLKGQLPTSLNDMTRRRARVIFVGMTRPKELLCLAMRKDHLEEGDRSALEAMGWYIQDLTLQ